MLCNLIIWTLDEARLKYFALFCWHNRVKGFYRGDFGSLFLLPLESENTDNSQEKHIFTMFLGTQCCINQCEWCVNKPLSKNLQNIDRNKTLSFGECKCCRSEETNSPPLKICIFTMFLWIKSYINPCKWYMNKPLYKNLQNTVRNKTLKCWCLQVLLKWRNKLSAIKNMHFHHVFRNKRLYKSVWMIYEQTPL